MKYEDHAVTTTASYGGPIVLTVLTHSISSMCWECMYALELLHVTRGGVDTRRHTAPSMLHVT